MNSGTTALHIALALLNVGAGDEIISTAMAAETTNTVILNAGGRPEESRVTWDSLSKMQLKDVYRALGDSYPILYIEDEAGNVLKFKAVEYKEAENMDKA